VTLGGFAGDYPPQDPAGFRAFAQSLGVLAFHAALEAAEPLGPPVGYRRTSNRWRDYHAMARWPAGFIALGDSVCAFNPYYGQGMAVAALSAGVLDALLRDRPGPGFPAEFQRRLARLWRRPG
jgi:2-polyprenyl-6-methoxyphenol hydroxylase-like FAD-dependent oxidoreductase